MIHYGIYEGELPELQVVIEGAVMQIFFDFEDVEHMGETEDEEGGVSLQNHFRCELVEVGVADYGEIISAIVRSRYSQDDVEAILSNYQLCKDGAAPEGKCEDYQDRYADYQNWRAKAKSVATGVLNI